MRVYFWKRENENSPGCSKGGEQVPQCVSRVTICEDGNVRTEKGQEHSGSKGFLERNSFGRTIIICICNVLFC